MTELDIAFEVARRLLNWTPSTVDHAVIEDVEVVAVDGSLAWISGGHR